MEIKPVATKVGKEIVPSKLRKQRRLIALKNSVQSFPWARGFKVATPVFQEDLIEMKIFCTVSSEISKDEEGIFFIVYPSIEEGRILWMNNTTEISSSSCAAAHRKVYPDKQKQ